MGQKGLYCTREKTEKIKKLLKSWMVSSDRWNTRISFFCSSDTKQRLFIFTKVRLLGEDISYKQPFIYKVCNNRRSQVVKFAFFFLSKRNWINQRLQRTSLSFFFKQKLLLFFARLIFISFLFKHHCLVHTAQTTLQFKYVCVE